MTRRFGGALIAMVMSGAILTGCAATTGAGPTTTGAGPTDASGASTELTVFAAASLKDAFARLADAYEAAHPGTDVILSTDSSAALATQIEQGAPADVFLSADRANAQRLVDGGFASGDAIDLAANALAIIVPADDPGDVATAADLAKPGLKIIAAGDAVPITGYAAQLVDALADQPGFPPDFAAAYRDNVVSREDNVKAIVAKIELGEGDAGIVYRTDALASDAVRTIDIPDQANVAATYAGVVIEASPHQAAARRFIDWLTGPDGRAILADFGFGAP